MNGQWLSAAGAGRQCAPASSVGCFCAAVQLNRQATATIVIRRVPYYLVIVAALLFIGVRGTSFVREVQAGHVFTQTEYLDLLKIPAMLLAIGVAIYRLRRQRQIDAVPPRSPNNRWRGP